MMKYLFLSSFLLNVYFCWAQKDTIDSAQEAFLTKRVASFKTDIETLKFTDSILASKSKKTDAFIAALYRQKAFSMSAINGKLLDTYFIEKLDRKDSTIQSILDLYTKAVDTCNYCKPIHTQNRYWFTKMIPFYKTETKKDLEYLKVHGYKEEFSGIVIGANYLHFKRPSLGLTLSLTSDYHPIYKLTSDSSTRKSPRILYRKKTPIFLQTACFNFSKLIYSRGYEASFSFLKLTSPFYIDPLQIGTIKINEIEDKNRWFWRPEIGLGYGPFAISTGYNVFFNKTARKTYDRMVFKVNLSYPLFNKESNE